MNTKMLALFANSVWAIQPEAVPLVIDRLSMPATDGRWEAAKPSTMGRGGNKVAVVPIQGVLSQDGPSYMGSSYEAITNAVERAAADPEVKRIILSVDSPGGNVTGLPECAAAIAAAAKVKPVSAIVEGTSASAAYWLTSQASDVTLTPSGEVGSVGVRMMHVDVSKALENDGVKVTEMSAGEFKTEWSPYKALTDEAKANMQTRLDANHQEFIGAIAAGRGRRVTADISANRFGEGRMFSSTEALGHGLVDKVQSTRDFYRTAAAAPEDPASSLPMRARLEIERARFA